MKKVYLILILILVLSVVLEVLSSHAENNVLKFILRLPMKIIESIPAILLIVGAFVTIKNIINGRYS
jgi:ABC-type methionine transport system permease subunit